MFPPRCSQAHSQVIRSRRKCSITRGNNCELYPTNHPPSSAHSNSLCPTTCLLGRLSETEHSTSLAADSPKFPLALIWGFFRNRGGAYARTAAPLHMHGLISSNRRLAIEHTKVLLLLLLLSQPVRSAHTKTTLQEEEEEEQFSVYPSLLISCLSPTIPSCVPKVPQLRCRVSASFAEHAYS